MSNRIIAYNDSTGFDIPSKVGVYPVELILPKKYVSDIFSEVDKCKLFLVFTEMGGVDFVVKHKADKELLESLLAFGKYQYTVDCRQNSIWYPDNAEKVILVSTTNLDMDSNTFATLISMFVNTPTTKGDLNTPREVYIVKNFRKGTEVMRTPIFSEAEKICNSSPCNIIVNKDGDIVTKSTFGKKPVKYSGNRNSNNIKKDIMRFTNR